MTERPQLGRLAERMGIVTAYTDAQGIKRRCSDATREALLAAMGLEASSEVEARRTLEVLDAEEERRWLEPVRLVEAGAAGCGSLTAAPPTGDGPLDWRLEIDTENGEIHRSEGRRRRAGSFVRLALPADLPRGVHDVRVAMRRGSGPWLEALQRLVIVPRSCPSVEEVLGDRHAFGLTAHLYSLRTRNGFGAGDLSALRILIDLAASEGAAFLGLNPLHALTHLGDDVSPYSPISRIYRSPFYVDLRRVPEWRAAPLDGPGDPADPAALARLRAETWVPHEEVARRKRAALGTLYERFRAQSREGDARARDFARYCEGEGKPLDAFATFLAIAEVQGESDWRHWPRELQRSKGPAVSRFAREHADAIELHRWVQFEVDRQWSDAAGQAREAGLRIGLMTDLALGSAPGGADTWTERELFAEGARAGAPPDAFNPDGQEWGTPPLHPHRISARGYDYWRRVLRANLRGAGALRLDHAMGLCRLYWVPEGGHPADGAYVRYPERDLLGILALESRRAGALVVGEDLGTLPRGLASRLARRNVLSTRVLLFEREGGAYRRSSRYSPRALVTANTHDLPTLAGWWQGRDLEPRRAAGHLADDEALAAAHRERAAERESLRHRLEDEGLLAPGVDDAEALAAAVTAFLCRTPSPLVGISLDDLAGEELPLNLPGVSQDRYPSWRRPIGVELDTLGDQPTARSMLAAIPGTRRGKARSEWRSTRGSSDRSTTRGQR